jgi:peptidoglycan/xylan/chitin deacetylase (PgdA/CDA1 family)
VIGENDNRSMVVTTENFEADLKYLRDNGYNSISLETLIDYYENPKIRLPDKPFVVTFDDGYLNNYEHAYPLLKKYNTKAVIYTIGWSVGRDKFILKNNPITPHFTWEQGKEMLDSGLIELGSHTFDMHSPAGLSYGYEDPAGLGLEAMENESREEYYSRIYKDIEKSKVIMEENLGREINTIAYPYGKYNDVVIQVVKDLGFKLGFIVDSEEENKSIFEIRRIPVTNDIRINALIND